MPVLRLAALAVTYTAALAAAPAISGVYNAGSWLPPALPNSGVAQGAIFTLLGSGLGPFTLQQAQTYPLPTTQGLSGTTIEVKVSGVTETCIMIYTSAAQVAAILPSATPVGTGTLTVSYQGASGSIPITVLPAGFGTLTLNEGGTGPAVVTDPSYVPITMINPAHPGDTLILWGTGLGAVAGDETEPPTETDLKTGVKVLVGNQPAMVTYGGRGSSPGLDQINFVVPAGVNGCKASIAVSVKGITGNITTTSIAPAGQSTCGDQVGALTTENLQKAVSNGSLNLGGVQLFRVGTGNDTLVAAFASYPVNSLIRSFGGSPGPSFGSCVAYEVTGSSFVLKDPIQPEYLGAGSQLTITGPGGTKMVDATSIGLFDSSLATQPSTYLEPGAYTVSNGTGGSKIGSFTWNQTLPNNVVPTNIPASINRAQNLTLTWTGGDAFPLVSIIGYAGVPLSSGLLSYSQFVCNVEGSAGQFTIPSEVLSVIPSNGYGAFGEPGVDIQIAGVVTSKFDVSGLDTGVFTVYESNGAIAKIE